MRQLASTMLRDTIDALGRLDVERLESLADQAERISEAEKQRSTIELAALCETLVELLRTTDENLRLLRGLHHARLSGLAMDPRSGGAEWAH